METESSEQSKDAIRARIREQVLAAARSKVEDDAIMTKVKHGLAVHRREERQRKIALRNERLEKTSIPGRERTNQRPLPKFLREEPQVKPRLAKESGDCNLVCFICNKYLFFPETEDLTKLGVEFLPCTHAVHAACKAKLEEQRDIKNNPLMCALCLKPMDREDFMWTGKLPDDYSDDE